MFDENDIQWVTKKHIFGAPYVCNERIIDD